MSLDERREHEKSKYLFLASERPHYGASNHAVKSGAIQYIGEKPEFTVDFGCGDNSFLKGQNLEGVGIDFVNTEADLVCPMHDVPIADDMADLVTSFDALEHLLPEEVEEVLEEMHRVAKSGGRLLFTISSVPSVITVRDENLHPTVEEPSWWLDKIGKHATCKLESSPHAAIYTGVWK